MMLKPPMPSTLLWIAALLLSPAGALAEDEDSEATPAEEDKESLPDPDELFSDLPDDEGGEGEGEGDPNISRVDEDDFDTWTLEGEQVEEKKPEKKDKTPVQKRELPPEPPRNGYSGNWYQVPVECAACPTLLDQKLGIEDPLVMREFFDHIQIESDKKNGRYVFPSIGQSRPLGVKGDGSHVVIYQYIIEQGVRLTDTYATIWDMQLLADGGVLYGRQYELQAWTKAAYETSEDGYKARPEFAPLDKLLAYPGLKPVQQLTLESPHFPVGEESRLTYRGSAAFVRSDVQLEAIALEQDRMRKQAEADAKRLRDQKEFYRKGEEALDEQDYERALAAFLKARELGLDNLDLTYNLGLSYQLLQDFDNAIAEYKVLLKSDPRDVDVRYNLARIYEKQKNWDAAIKEYQAMLKFDPDDQDARHRLELLRQAREMIQ